MTTGDCLRTLEVRNYMGYGEWVNCLAVLGDGITLASASSGTVRLWNTKEGVCTHTFRHSSGTLKCLAVLPDGSLASGSHDGTVKLWDTNKEKHLKAKIKNGRRGKSAYMFFCAEERVKIKEELPDLTPREVMVELVRRWKKTKTGDTSKWDELAKKEEMATRTGPCCIRTFKGHPYWGDGSPLGMECLAVLPDGSLASGSKNGMVNIWNTTTGSCTRTLDEGHTWRVQCLAVLPDGSLASGSENGTVKLWDTRTGVCIRTLRRFTRGISGTRGPSSTSRWLYRPADQIMVTVKAVEAK